MELNHLDEFCCFLLLKYDLERAILMSMLTLLDYFSTDENAKILARIKAFVKERYPRWKIVEVKLCRKCKRLAVVLIRRGKNQNCGFV